MRNLSDIHRIEHVVRTAVVTVHINFAVFRHDAVDLFIRQGFQRASAALAGAGALKFHGLRIVNRHFFFVVQTPQHVGRRQVEQLFRFDGFGQRCQVLKVIGLCVLRRQNLQQHTARSRLTVHFTGADEERRVGSCSERMK